MTKGFDEKIRKLKVLEDKIAELSAKKEDLRKDVFAYFEKESLNQYKVDGVATIARVVKKVIKSTVPQEKVIADLERQGLVKYLMLVPAVPAIPERKVLNTDFDKDIKEGTLTIEGITVETSSSIMTRFDK